MDSTALKKEEGFYNCGNGRQRRKTTVGWSLLVQCENGDEIYIPLREMKESNPLQVAKYAKARGLLDEPAFAWWCPYVLKKNRYIASKVKARRVTHKMGIELPRSVEHALELDKKNGNNEWEKAIKKESTNVRPAFDILPEGEAAPIDYTKSSVHMVFDVKMDFTRKARLVKDGHKTEDIHISNYAGVVSRESVRIAFTYAALNGLDVWVADIQNAYLQAPTSEKHYIICGREFGIENVGRVAIICRALYGGKLAGRDYWKHMRAFMNSLGFVPSKGDPEVWMREAVTEDGHEYWEYVLLYVDDCLVISHRGKFVLEEEIGKHFVLKPASIGPPHIYLGGKVSIRTISDEEDGDIQCWSFSSSLYVKQAVANVQNYLKSADGKRLGITFPKGERKSTFSSNYRPEIDESAELDADGASYYQSLIGIVRWIVELGRVDIITEVSMLASCMALPRYGHLKELINIFAYLKYTHNTEMVFDPTTPEVNMEEFEREDWSYTVYARDGIQPSEELPPDMPKARGCGFIMSMYVDSDHAGDHVTRRSRTGFLVYLQRSLICWHSKKQTSVETSTFGSEFMAMKTATEYIIGLRYKLRMMGIPVQGPCYVYGDNQAVLANSRAPDSMLKKKSNSIAYHFVREGCSRDVWRCAYIKTDDNPADICTKPLPYSEKRVKFCKMLLHHLYGYVGHVTKGVNRLISSIMRH